MRTQFKHIGWTKKVRKKGKYVLEPRIYPYRVEIKILAEEKVDVNYTTNNDGEKAIWTPHTNILDDIVFIADKSRTWNQYIQVSIIRITEEDYDTISLALTG